MPHSMTKSLVLLLSLLMPIVIVTAVVSLLITDPYLRFEYSKASFPSDSFGFTNQQRFNLASTNIHYVRAHLPLDGLAKQTLSGGPVYNPRELSHMADVRGVIQALFQVRQFAFLLVILLGVILWWNGERMAIAAGLQWGGLLTFGIILGIALLAIFAWQFWFNTFHQFFFQPGSWLFSYSDALIRLFPLKFWFDATLTISFLSLIGGFAVTLVGRHWQRTFRKSSETILV